MKPIYKNIYYMLSYAFQVLNEGEYRKIETEKFENTAELMAAILCIGVSKQIKRGLQRAYIEETEALSAPKGKIDISASIKAMTIQKKQLVCTYDDFSVNSYQNRIIKTTLSELLKADISKDRKKQIKKLLVYFCDIEVLDKHTINWRQHFDRNNQTYYMLIAVCNMILKGLLQTQADGSIKMQDFFDEQKMHALYEKFILEYYKKEYKGKLNASASFINWDLEPGSSDFMLPAMKSDIMLSSGNHVLIIDAKYYSRTTQVQFDKNTIHSANLYQIFAYVKNKDAEFGSEIHEVSGMLLYAKTDEEIQPNSEYRMGGNKIIVRTLDLNQEFSRIKDQLNGIIQEHFGMI